MSYGYHGKILKVDLTTKTVTIDEHDDIWYRTYMGGACIGAYYLLNEMDGGVDPLGPDNLLIAAPSLITGAPIPGLSRHAVITKSPATNMFLDSQAGGWWAPEFKFTGYDAIVIRGKSEKPCYIWIDNGEVEFRDAANVWGMDTGDAQEAIRQEVEQPRARMLMIGPAGENMVKYACILNECKHANGRGGTGAVMGSKNLKAIAVKGDKKKFKMFDKEKALALSKWFSQNYMDNPADKSVHYFGTADLISWQSEHEELPTRNFANGDIEDAEKISGAAMTDTVLVKREGCYACPVQCKRVVKTGEPYNVDPFYGGPEYETMAAFGSVCGITDLEAVCKANEKCNRYALDTISTGVVIAFAMECFENGLLSKEECDGLEPRFGDIGVMLELIDKIGRKEGNLGKLLSEGTKEAARIIGKGAEQYAMHCKGMELAIHDPRARTNVGLGYAASPIGGDHVVVEHDPDFDEYAPELYIEQARCLGLLERLNSHVINEKKIRSFVYLQNHFSLLDTLTVCAFCFAPVRLFKMRQLVEIVDAVTGWENSLWELMKLGERRVNMAKAFNYREGMRREHDILPKRFYKPLEKTNQESIQLSEKEVADAIDLIYEMSNWEKDGRPRKGKLHELDLGWVIPKIYR